MANWTMTNILSNAVELPKYIEVGTVDEVYSVALTTALANGDTLLGPILPAGCFLTAITIDCGQLDSNGSPTISFEVGYTGALAAFIAAATVGRAGGFQGLNVPGCTGFTAATSTQILMTITAGPATAKAGTVIMKLSYTASP